MAITPEQLSKILNHNASTLCSQKGDRKLNELKGAMNYDALNQDMVSDEWDDFSLSDPMDPKPQSTYNQPITEDAVSRSRMPDAIKESMLKNQIDTSALGKGLGDTSFLDSLPQQKQYFNKQKIVEQAVPQQVQYIPQQTIGIDYNYLKHIISECIAEYFSKQSINESFATNTATLKQIGLSEGKIKLVDNKGNVYGADLEYKGNINERKNKKS